MPTQRDPMLLDSTGQAIVLKLDGIKTAIENGGGGGGGSAPSYLLVKAYDTTIKRHGQYQSQSYCPGDYCLYDSKVYRCITNVYYADPTSAFDSTCWEEIVDIPTEISGKPGKMDAITKAEVFNDYANNQATGEYSHAEGRSSQARSSYAHAEGNYTEATGTGSHAEGSYSKAKGQYSHAGGNSCNANGGNSFAHGNYVTANGQNEFAVGTCNIEYISDSDLSYFNSSWYYYTGDKVMVGDWLIPDQHNIYQANTDISPGPFDATQWDVVGEYTPANEVPLFSVGNGSGSYSRSNAFEVLRDGSAKLGNQKVIAIDPPTTDGTYTLQCTVTNGVATYAWV